MTCPFCACRLLRHTEDGRVKLKAPIFIFSQDGTKCTMPCPKCGHEIQIPVTLSKDAIQNSERSRVVLSR